jgi:hypothetical protein
MLTIHAVRTGNQIILSEKDFLKLIQNARRIEPVKIIETETEIIETAEDRQAYIEAIEDLEQGNTLDFNDLKSSWCLGKSADV